ncbi:transcriptional regulator [uncultured Chitinophaga sp.]|jgi:hypothetical protein|uniref:winged helix-turn-helix domain-containing protein n=1 Tax=uncultured Chitinophaga sp. TaxID=339340 RepID=UPI0026264877|nr:transcriptional regulator [uncultured Chitinophaga sp.]
MACSNEVDDLPDGAGYGLWAIDHELHFLPLHLSLTIEQRVMMYFKDLDPVLHSQLRLAVMSILVSVQEAEFTLLKERTNATAGNLSVQINKLKEAGYIEVIKQFRDNYPQTLCRITGAGRLAFESYVNAIQSYLKPGKTG